MADPALAELATHPRSLLHEAGLRLDVLDPCVEALRAHEVAALAALTELDAEALRDRLCLDGGLLATLTGLQLERSLGLYLDGPAGPVIGGSWAIEPDLAEHVALRPLELGAKRPALAFGLPGGLPFAGISAAGFAIVSQALRPARFEPGLPGSVVLRELLACASLERVRERLDTAVLADGRNWMLADGVSFFGYEHLQARAVLTRLGRKVSHVHANHCFDPALRQLEGRPRSPLSFRRLELASTLYIQRQPSSAEAMLEFFAEVETEAFAEASERAGCALAIELGTGRAMWRTRLDGPLTLTNFDSPLAG